MNNSAMRYYFLAKFGGSFTNIFRNICIQFCQDLFRFVIFCRTLSSGLLLFRTRCISCDLLKLCAPLLGKSWKYIRTGNRYWSVQNDNQWWLSKA